jgi:hypothetical protein
VRFAERLVGSDRDARGLLSVGQNLEEQVSAAFVEFEIAQFVDLCRYPHRSTYADIAIMPRTLVAGGCPVNRTVPSRVLIYVTELRFS